MRPLLLGALLLGSLRVRVTAEVMLDCPSKVRFDSVDYKNILRWNSPNNSTSLQYCVQWKIYGRKEWLNVSHCQGTQKRHCDLSSVTSELREWYYARVRASSVSSTDSSAWALSHRFSPLWDTIISPPVLRLSSTDQGIVVRVKPPREVVQKKHKNLYFKIYVTHPSGAEEEFDLNCCSHKLALGKLNSSTKYCLQAQTVLPRLAKSSNRSACISTL
ncbi:interleukin-22 receptor subunit alpha-2 isoform 1-T1 [Pholidichthys leucotaenia]